MKGYNTIKGIFNHAPTKLYLKLSQTTCDLKGDMKNLKGSHRSMGKLNFRLWGLNFRLGINLIVFLRLFKGITKQVTLWKITTISHQRYHILTLSAPTNFWRCFWIVQIHMSLVMSKRLKWACRNRTFYPPGPFSSGRQLKKITFIGHRHTRNQVQVHLQKKSLKKKSKDNVESGEHSGKAWPGYGSENISYVSACRQIYMLIVGMCISLETCLCTSDGLLCFILSKFL